MGFDPNMLYAWLSVVFFSFFSRQAQAADVADHDRKGTTVSNNFYLSGVQISFLNSCVQVLTVEEEEEEVLATASQPMYLSLSNSTFLADKAMPFANGIRDSEPIKDGFSAARATIEIPQPWNTTDLAR